MLSDSHTAVTSLLLVFLLEFLVLLLARIFELLLDKEDQVVSKQSVMSLSVDLACGRKAFDGVGV
jgi:hypothetical protein